MVRAVAALHVTPAGFAPRQPYLVIGSFAGLGLL